MQLCEIISLSTILIPIFNIAFVVRLTVLEFCIRVPFSFMNLSNYGCFFCQNIAEATAAHAAGMKTALVLRPGNPKLSDKDLETFLTISSFSDLFSERQAEVPQKKVCHEEPSPKKSYQAAHAAQAQ